MVKKGLYTPIIIIFCSIVTLVLSNVVFSADITATIVVAITEPEAPVNLAATVGDRSVALSWSPPSSDGGSAITDYVIEYKLTTGGVWSTFSDGVNTLTSVDVTGLSNDNSYDFRVSAVNISGQGASSSSVSATPGSPAQVIISGFSDLTVSTIATDLRITNEGGIAYEYQYTWCVTDSDTNLCGDGDDVFGSTAAKLINPGENFDTTLDSTVTTPGSYWFHVEVTFGSDSSIASQSFTAVSASSPSGGGGGGGGGSSSGSSATNTVCGVGADLNCDNIVNSIDFSILLAFWKTSPPFKNPAADINSDGKVDSVDFSILLYEWGKRPTPFEK